jgi:hypothetical protein
MTVVDAATTLAPHRMLKARNGRFRTATAAVVINAAVLSHYRSEFREIIGQSSTWLASSNISKSLDPALIRVAELG